MADPLTIARLTAGLSVSEACDVVGRSLRTWQHWRKHGAPRWALRVLAIYGGDLSPLGWDGWRIHRGKLYAPHSGYHWTEGQLFAEWWDRQRLAKFLRDARESKSVCDACLSAPGSDPAVSQTASRQPADVW